MLKRTLNPFIYGRPVPTGRFYGRQDQVQTIFSRLFNGESTAIVGEPHIGKTSLLSYIADEKTRHEWIEQVFAQYSFTDFDCHLMGADFKPAEFWGQVLGQVASQIEDDAIQKQYQSVEARGYAAFDLESLFRLIGRRGYRVSLLIDEFDTLLDHPNFREADFLAALRSLATRTDGLALITASRLSVAQMNRKSQYRSQTGSPFFNNMIEVRLPHLTYDEAQALLANTLEGSGGSIRFEPDDFALAYSLAGRHPFLLQIAGAALFDAIEQSGGMEQAAAGQAATPRAAIEERAENRFHQVAAAHFEDYWRTLEEPDQRTILVLALFEQGARARPGAQRTPVEIPQWFKDDIQRLVGMGAVELSEAGPMLSVGGLRRWLMENVVAGTRYAADFSTWLNDKGRQNLLTRQEIDRLLEFAERVLAASPSASEAVNLARLREKLKGYDNQQLRHLCAGLEVDYDTLGGATAEEKAAELILYAQRWGLIPALLEAIRVDDDNPAATQQQLEALRANLRLVEERIADYVQETDVPLQLRKDERRIQQQISELEARLGQET